MTYMRPFQWHPQWIALVQLLSAVLIEGAHIPTQDEEAISVALNHVYPIAASVMVMLAAVVALACCGCAACQSKGAVHPLTSNEHTHQIKQIVHERRRADPLDIRTAAMRLFNIGVRSDTVDEALRNPAAMTRLGITEADIAAAHGRDGIVEQLRMVEESRKPKQQLVVTPHGLDVNDPAPQGKVNKKQLDEQADFDDYTVYDEGGLNEYGVLKAEKKKKVEGGAGLDEKADFDDYTVYDEGEMNEYGVLKAEREHKHQTSAGLDEKADFDDYTIYDEGPLNEYAVVKERVARREDAPTGLDEKADFDDYTVYDEGPLNEYGLVKEMRQSQKSQETKTAHNDGRVTTGNTNVLRANPDSFYVDDVTYYAKGQLPAATGKQLPTAAPQGQGQKSRSSDADDDPALYEQGLTTITETGGQRGSAGPEMYEVLPNVSALNDKLADEFDDIDDSTIYTQRPQLLPISETSPQKPTGRRRTGQKEKVKVKVKVRKSRSELSDGEQSKMADGQRQKEDEGAANDDTDVRKNSSSEESALTEDGKAE